MDLEFSDDEAALRESVGEVIAGISPTSVVRAIYEGTGDADEVWRQMVALDWPGLALPEEHGGVGMGFLELAIVAEQLGKATVPGPFLATATQFAPAILELGGPETQKAYLPRVAAGELTGALAIAEAGSWRMDALGATAAAKADGDGWVLAGRKEAVLDGATAEEVVVIARADAGLGAFVVPREQLEVCDRPTVDATLRLADVVLDGVRVPADRVVAAPGRDVAAGVERVLQQATVVVATNIVAACREIFDQTLAYAKEREQYGRPIGSFQALKHRLADMYLAVERASSVCWFAALTIVEDDPQRAVAASVAKAAASECQQLLVTDGLQLHGGIGFTWEHDLHFLLKRAKAADALFGNAITHRARLAELLGVTTEDAA